jgi:hypothetical protein
LTKVAIGLHEKRLTTYRLITFYQVGKLVSGIGQGDNRKDSMNKLILALVFISVFALAVVLRMYAVPLPVEQSPGLLRTSSQPVILEGATAQDAELQRTVDGGLLNTNQITTTNLTVER